MTTESFTPGDMLLGDVVPVARKVTIASGADVVRGAVLGRVTASDKYILSASAAADGSQTPVLVAAENIEASGADGTGLAYEIASLDGAKLTYGTGHDADTVEAAFRQAGKSLFVRTVA